MSNYRPCRITLYLIIVLIAISLFFGCEGCTDQLTIKITDKNKTPNYRFRIAPSSDITKPIQEGRADIHGTAERTIRVSDVANLTISVKAGKGNWTKVAYISVEQINKALRGKKKLIVRQINLIPAQKKIIFKSPNVEGINIYGRNESNQRALLGTTNSEGEAEISLPHSIYKRVSFSYSLPSATVFTSGSNRFAYEELPSTKVLQAIPTQEIRYEFMCIDSSTNEGIEGVLVTSPDGEYSGATNSDGYAEIRINPDQESGPLIGEIIDWSIDSDLYIVLNPPTTVVSTNIVPRTTVEMKRSYCLTIRAVEGTNPIPNQYITINGERYEPTWENGAVTYLYFAEDFDRNLTIGIEEMEGRSAEPQSIRLGRISRTITLRVETIHQFLSCYDPVTNQLLRSIVVSGTGVQSIYTDTGTSTKIVFPRLGEYTLRIKDTLGLYTEKTVLLTVNNSKIGNTKIVYLDPISRIDFVIVDANTQSPISTPSLMIDGQAVTDGIQNGKYTYTFERDDLLRIEVQIKAKNYASKSISIDRTLGITNQNVPLDKLFATLIIKSQDGKPAQGIKVKSGQLLVGDLDDQDQGRLKLYPEDEGQEYNLTISSENGFYEESILEFKFEFNGQEIEHVVQKQPCLEFRVFQPTDFGNIPIEGVTVTSSTSQVGTTGNNGQFLYKIFDPDNEVTFNFKKSSFESIELRQSTNQRDQVIDVPMPRLEAFFYIRDSRTQNAIPYVSIWVNGLQETSTDQNGRANIFPTKRPMDLSIEARSPGDDYHDKTVTKNYTQPNLDIIYLEPRPIKLHVTLRWARSGLPVNGGLEIVPSHLQYNLQSSDNGRHTFDYYYKNSDPKLIITANTPTNNPFTKEVPISLAMAINGEINIPLNLQPRPRINVSVDDGVRLAIYRHTVNNTLVAIETDLIGGYIGELPDFGEYTFVRYSGSFVKPDSIYKIVTRSDEYLDLRRQPFCAEADVLYANQSWEQFIEKVNHILAGADCYASSNKKAAEVCKDKLNRYKVALNYYQKITSGPVTSLIGGIDPQIDPYIRLNMLECCFLEVKRESRYNTDNLALYEIGKNQATKFDNLIHLLGDNRVQAQSKKEFLYCKLLIDEFWSLEPTSENISAGLDISKVMEYRENLYATIILRLERYQDRHRIPEFPSLQNELAQLRNTSP
jgi:hypothetical protein